ncbi:MAG TPA: hypothetical protein VNL18_09755 [Gemmatimonadales bacterium]|nr:hypothetical protein [Gemmatimonadales bacterium]
MSSVARESRLPGYLSLFASVGTLVCCALPATLVLAGLGATVASVLSALPWLVTLSRHKDWVFAVTGILIAANGYYVYRLAPRLAIAREACPPGQADRCARVSRLSRAMVLVSAGIYVLGAIVAYALGPILAALET